MSDAKLDFSISSEWPIKGQAVAFLRLPAKSLERGRHVDFQHFA